VLSACGGTSQRNALHPSGSSSSKASASEFATAKQSLVQLSDFPAGWKAQGSVTTLSGQGGGLSTSQLHQLAGCLGVSVADINTNPPQADSPNFHDPAGSTTITDEVQVYPTAAQAENDYSTFSSPKTPGCLLQVLGTKLHRQISSELAKGQTVGQLTASALSFPTYGDHSGDIQVVAPIVQRGVTIPLYIDLVVLVKDRSESTVISISPVPSPALLQQLAQGAANRMG
jgi:hypothetical protein